MVKPWAELEGRDRHAACMLAARDGDKEAFDALIADLAPLVWHVARGSGLDRTSAEDVVQTVWLALLRHLHRLTEPRALAGWLIPRLDGRPTGFSTARPGTSSCRRRWPSRRPPPTRPRSTRCSAPNATARCGPRSTSSRSAVRSCCGSPCSPGVRNIVRSPRPCTCRTEVSDQHE